MKKMIKLAMIATLLLTGCIDEKKESAEGHYSGCTFIIESGNYYNVGIELHYDNDTEMDYNYSLEKQLDQALSDLEEENDSTIDLKEDGTYYCSDSLRAKSLTWRKGYAIPHDKKDDLIETLSDFTFDLTLKANATDKVYESEITLPVKDISQQRKEEEEEKRRQEEAEAEAEAAQAEEESTNYYGWY